MAAVATYTLLVLLSGAAGVAVLIALVRAARTVWRRRQARLGAGPRQALLGFVADGGAEGADELTAIPPAAWRAAEPTAIALLGKIKGEAHAALAAVFERRGAVDAARRALLSRGHVARARAAETLGNLGRRDAVTDLLRLLTDRQAEVRVVAIRALGRIGDPAAAEPLLATLADEPPAPSQMVAHALIQLGSAAEPDLIGALRHPAPLVRMTALDALGLLGAAGGAGPVAGVLREDASPDVRVAAAATLGRLGARSALEPLIASTAPTEPVPLRVAAARALGELGGAAAVPPLRDLLSDPQYRVAHEAAHALRRLGTAGLAALREVASPLAADQPAAVDRPLATGQALAAAEALAAASAARHAAEALAMAAVREAPADPEPVQTLATVG